MSRRQAKPQADSRAASRPRAESPVKRFRTTLDRHEDYEAYGIRVPFDVRQVFGTRARVPVRGTLNGFPFRSSIFPEGDGTHYMAVNREVRAGAGVEGGQTV